MTLGECINSYLNEHEMSMRKFASLAGVTHAYISNIVNGKTSRGNSPVPSLTVYRGIAQAMGMDVNTLISIIDDDIAWGNKTPTTESDGHTDSELSDKDKRLIDWFRSLPPEKQQAILVSQDAPKDLL